MRLLKLPVGFEFGRPSSDAHNRDDRWLGRPVKVATPHRHEKVATQSFEAVVSIILRGFQRSVQ